MCCIPTPKGPYLDIDKRRACVVSPCAQLLLYILRPQSTYIVTTLRPKYLLFAHMDPWVHPETPKPLNL